MLDDHPSEYGPPNPFTPWTFICDPCGEAYTESEYQGMDVEECIHCLRAVCDKPEHSFEYDDRGDRLTLFACDEKCRAKWIAEADERNRSLYLAEAFRIAAGDHTIAVRIEHLQAVVEHGRRFVSVLMEVA